MSAPGVPTAGGLSFKSQPLPLAPAILWGPAGAGAAPDALGQPFPIFLDQQALKQLIVHTRSAPGKVLMGFLLGELCQCPETGIRYCRIEQGLRVGAEVPGDHTSALLAKVWPRLQESITSLKKQVIGWYHTHATGGTAFSREDIGTQLMYFAQGWQVGLVLGTEDGKPAAGWFRVSQAENWSSVRLPFYEVLSPESIDTSGKKHSHIDWANFKPFKAVAPLARKAPPPRPAPPPPRPAPPVPPPPHIPVQAEPPQPEPEAEPAPGPAAEPEPEPPHGAPAFTRVSSPSPVEKEEPGAGEPVAEAPEETPPPMPRPVPTPVVRPVRPSFSLAEARAQVAPKPPGMARFWIGAGLGAGATALLVAAGWYLGYLQVVGRPVQTAAIQEPTSQVPAPQQQAAAAPQGAAQPAAAQPEGAGQAAAQPTLVQPPPARPAPPASGPAAPQVDPRLVGLDRLTDSVLAVLRAYRQRGAAFDQGQRDCAPLSQALVGVEGLWASYHQRKPQDITLDAQRTAREQSLSAQVDTVESHFRASACPRP